MSVSGQWCSEDGSSQCFGRWWASRPWTPSDQDRLWRERRNANLLGAVQRMGDRAAMMAAHTDHLRAVQRRHEGLVYHLLYATGQWLDSYTFRSLADGQSKVSATLSRQSSLLSLTQRSSLKLSTSEEMLLEQALDTVWQRESEHRRQLTGPAQRRRSDSSCIAGQTGQFTPPLPRPPVVPAFPMQDPGKEVEIKETEVKVVERRENEWTAEWDWAERERRRNAERAARRRGNGQVPAGAAAADHQAAADGAAAQERQDAPDGGEDRRATADGAAAQERQDAPDGGEDRRATADGAAVQERQDAPDGREQRRAAADGAAVQERQDAPDSGEERQVAADGAAAQEQQDLPDVGEERQAAADGGADHEEQGSSSVEQQQQEAEDGVAPQRQATEVEAAPDKQQEPRPHQPPRSGESDSEAHSERGAMGGGASEQQREGGRGDEARDGGNAEQRPLRRQNESANEDQGERQHQASQQRESHPGAAKEADDGATGSASGAAALPAHP
ncbi:filaggrin-like [Pollicipes pollicipes]|uniref:filaggrin-like n=1 Tax=Pollicipes pollicipes TaxID=41117 RepID=UPI001884EEC0|nr:filaggrin-like [Pollicipes pollicipes]